MPLGCAVSPVLASLLASVAGAVTGGGVYVWLYDDGNPRWVAVTVGTIIAFTCGANCYTLLEGP